MSKAFGFKVVDLFAGPGGLAEGFSRLVDAEGNRPFEIALSVEKESSAFSTLRLRSFFRQFGAAVPDAYYRYIAGEIGRDELTALHPDEWADACEETLQLELGAPGFEDRLFPLLDRIRDDASGQTVLIGGPPCQAYSLVGRSRNSGKSGYNASDDHRHYLYEQYIRIIGRLQPVAFVMENVKGILSSRVNGEAIFPRVLADLRAAGGGSDSYRLLPLVSRQDRRGSEHVLEAERFGVPQCRHRVILFGVRADVAANIESDVVTPTLRPALSSTTVSDAIDRMPELRSGISRGSDDPGDWRETAEAAFRTAAEAAFAYEDELLDGVAEQLMARAVELGSISEVPPRRSTSLAPVTNNELAAWLTDPKLTSLPNHHSRSHMAGDLARYAFATVFTKQVGRSPKAGEFPDELAPDHRNWRSGKFSDRFRVQRWNAPSTTVTSHISKDGHYFIHPDPLQCRSLTVREAARLQTFPDNYLFEGNRTEQFIQVGNAVPPLLAVQIAEVVNEVLQKTAARRG